MPRIIQTPRPLVARENVYISQKQLKHAQRAQNVLDEAQRGATQLIKESQKEAEALKQKAMHDGYRDGVLAAASSILAYFDNGRRLGASFREKLGKQAEEMLKAALDHPELILVLLDEWLRTQQDTGDVPLQLLLPRYAYAAHAQIMACLEASWCARVQIEYHDDKRFILRSVDQVAEFDPSEFLQQGKAHLMRGISQVDASCYQLDQEAMQAIRDCFEKRLNTVGRE